MNYNYVFVLSMPRSGSTLFRMLLSNVDGCVSLPETFFFPFYNQYKYIDITSVEGKNKLIDNWINFYTVKLSISNLEELKVELINQVVSFKDILNVTVKQYLKENNISNPKYIIEKSPPHIFFQKDIKQLFPNSKAIYLIRDPRSVAGSMLNKKWATHNIYSIARSWNKSCETVGLISNSAYVRYEDLVDKDAASFEKIKSLLVTSISKEEFYNKSEEVNFKGVIKDYHPNLSSPITNKHSKKWVSQLSSLDQEIQIIEHVCKKEMIKWDYEFSNAPKSKAFWFLLFTDAVKFAIAKFSK